MIVTTNISRSTSFLRFNEDESRWEASELPEGATLEIPEDQQCLGNVY
jgi:hypothetical protein